MNSQLVFRVFLLAAVLCLAAHAQDQQQQQQPQQMPNPNCPVQRARSLLSSLMDRIAGGASQQRAPDGGSGGLRNLGGQMAQRGSSSRGEFGVPFLR